MKNSQRARRTSVNDNVTRNIVGELDVLWGRGRGFYQHRGNLRMHEILLPFKPVYKQASSRSDKRAIVLQCIEKIQTIPASMGHVCSSIRFMALNKESDTYYEASRKQTIDKLSHALREKPKRRRTASSDLPAASSPVCLSSPCILKEQNMDQEVAIVSDSSTCCAEVEHQEPQSEEEFLSDDEEKQEPGLPNVPEISRTQEAAANFQADLQDVSLTFEDNGQEYSTALDRNEIVVLPLNEEFGGRDYYHDVSSTDCIDPCWCRFKEEGDDLGHIFSSQEGLGCCSDESYHYPWPVEAL